MKIQTCLLYGVLVASAVSAQAAEFDPPLSVSSAAGAGKTRAEVKAETLRALAAGEVSFGDVGYPTSGTAASSLPGRTRADVKAETRQALAAGEIPFGDAAAYPRLATTGGGGATRAEVKSELLRAIAAHEVHFSDAAYPDGGIVTTPRTRSRGKAIATSPTSMPSMSMTPAS